MFHEDVDIVYQGFMSEIDLDYIKEYTEMCDKHGAEAVDDYMELHDDLDNFEVIAQHLVPPITLLW